MLSQTQSMIFSIVMLNLLGQLSPGPDILMISKTALTYSRWNAFKVVLGVCSGVAFWLFLTIQGYSALLQRLPWLQYGFMLSGGAYLMYNGYQMLRTHPQQSQIQAAAPVKQSFYYKGLMTNLSNPKMVLYLTSVLSPLLGDIHNPSLKYKVMIILIIQALLTFCLLLWLFSLPIFKRHYLRFGRIIDCIGGFLFICFGSWLYIQTGLSLWQHS